jgi:hypothetical protein
MLQDESQTGSFFDKLENKSGWIPRAGKPIRRLFAGDLQ